MYCRNYARPVRVRGAIRLPRRGVSLMEVMFSLGIIMVGLLGVAVLIPVAGKMANDGALFDRASREGLAAVREFELRGMGRPANWVHLADGVDNDSDMQTDEDDEIRVGGGFPLSTGYCLDPQFLAANNNGTTIPMQARFFPYVNLTNPPDPSDLRMRRISLYNGFGGTGVNMCLGLAMAEEWFVSQDDLTIDTPDDATIPAQQVYGQAADKRQYDGKISWMATLAPRNEGISASQDTYILSIVVFNLRDRAMPMDGLTERVAWIPHSATMTGFHSFGATGGEVSIAQRSNGALTDLDVKRGEWVMLARKSPAGPIFRWYKIMEVDPGIADSAELSGSNPTSGTPIRHLTLYGPDWLPDVNNNTLVYIVPGVIAVFEKTVKLESTNLWSP